VQKDDVPQDSGLFGKWHEISYAVDRDGKYVKVPSVGWTVSNSANIQAWEEYFEVVEETRKRAAGGELSPVAYYMAVNQMDVKLLARNMRIAGWRVKRHLNPAVFGKLKTKILERYSSVFNIPVEQLNVVPDAPLQRPEFLEAAEVQAE
jgi:hypothetical protein